MGNILKNVAIGLSMVAGIQTFGALFELYHRRFFNPSVQIALIVWSLVIVAALLGRRFSQSAYKRNLPVIGTTAVLFVIGSILGFGAVTHTFFQYHPDYDLWTYPASSKIEDCWKGRGCNTYSINRFGLRGPDHAKQPGSTRLAMIGDSWMFSSGVKDGYTLSETLDKKLKAKVDDKIETVSAALSGRSINSFVRQAKYAAAVYDPDAYLVLLKKDDANVTDFNTRIARTACLTPYGLLVGLNLEFMYNYLTNWGGTSKYSPSELAHQMENLYKNTGGHKMLLITTLQGDYLKEIARWALAHPNVFHIDMLENQTWAGASKITNDEHWSAEGVETIANLMLPYVEKVLTTDKPFLAHSTRTLRDLMTTYPDEHRKDASNIARCLREAGITNLSYGDNRRSVIASIDPDHAPISRLRVYHCKSGEHYARIGDLCFSIVRDHDSPPSNDDVFQAFLKQHESAVNAACSSQGLQAGLQTQ